MTSATGASTTAHAGRASPARSSVLTVCPFCSCGCGLYLQSRNGVLSGVMPSEHHPVSRGRLCARGWAAHEATIWGGRLTRPQVRRDGKTESVDWETGLRMAAQRIGELRAAGKPIGVLGSGRATNEENFLAARLARGALATGHIDSCLRAQYDSLLSGICESGISLSIGSALEDLEHCEVILLLEGNVALTHPHVALSLMRAKRRGARIVTIGATRTQLSRLAHAHIPLVPGEEPALAAGLAAGVERGVAEGSADLREAVAAYAAAARAAIILAPTGAAAPTLRAVAVACAGLAARTGHLQRPGSLLLPLPTRANTLGALEMGALPDRLPGLATLDDEGARTRLREAWGREPGCQQGLDVDRMLGEVRGLIIVADDPLTAVSSVRAARTALAGLECLVVLDAFATAAVHAAHVALPIAGPAEAEGTFTNLEGRVQRLQPAVPPPGDARQGWRALAELTTALGMPPVHATLQDVLRDIALAVPEYGAALAQAKAPGEGVSHVVRIAHAKGAAPSFSGGGSPAATSAEFPFRLARAEVFEWGDDVLVDSSPTLRRDHASLRKLFPDGVLDVNAADAQQLGIREGWKVKVTSAAAAVTAPVRLRDDLARGVVLVPHAFRELLEPVLAGGVTVAVSLSRT